MNWITSTAWGYTIIQLATYYCDLIFEFNLNQQIAEPTHKGGNLLYAILSSTNCIENISVRETLPYGLSSEPLFDKTFPCTVPMKLSQVNNPKHSNCFQSSTQYTRLQPHANKAVDIIPILQEDLDTISHDKLCKLWSVGIRDKLWHCFKVYLNNIATV